MRKIKAGKRGEATKYISRAKAIRKLQLSLKDFRRMCILKGVYPREPPKKLKKNNRTYYHLKDINFLSLDPIITKMRAQKVHLRKYRKAKAKGDIGKIKYLAKQKPSLSLNHLVRERYPDFIDALRDLDDPLSMLALFSIFPTHKEFSLSSSKIEASTNLLKYFQLYVIESHCLKKVFVSIKGIYYQVQILGQTITYITPYRYPPNLPVDVDYRVMSTFLDFYITLLKFVNYKLYLSLNIAYPPQQKQENDYNYLGYSLERVPTPNAQDDKYQIDQQFAQKQNKEEFLFSGLKFYLSTEVPRQSLQYVVLAMGGTLTYLFDPLDKNITHVITDRETPNVAVVPTKEYVQPQWVYDCVNFNHILNVNEYAYNVTELPPHISPFFDEKDTQRYIPERQKQLRGLSTNKKQQAPTTQNKANNYDIITQRKQQLQQKKHDAKQFKQISKNILTTKNKKLSKVIEHGIAQKQQEREKLEHKAAKLNKK